MVCLATPCCSSLIFARCDFVERKAWKDFLWSSSYSCCLLPWTPAGSAEPRGFFWIEPLLLIHVWCLLTGLECCFCVWCFRLDCWYPDNEDQNHPKEQLLNRSTSPYHINNLSPLISISGLEGRWKRLRTLVKVGFENLSLHRLSSTLKCTDYWNPI